MKIQWWIWGIVVGVIICLVNNSLALKCDRVPEGAGANKSPADGRFRIRITGNPERYIPGEVYTSKSF